MIYDFTVYTWAVGDRFWFSYEPPTPYMVKHADVFTWHRVKSFNPHELVIPANAILSGVHLSSRVLEFRFFCDEDVYSRNVQAFREMHGRSDSVLSEFVI